MARSAPFATGEVNKRLNARLWAGEFAELTGAELGLLRLLIALASWDTGVIPYSKDRIAQAAHMHPDTVSRMRAKLCAAGLLEERWRTSVQVQYGLGAVLRG